jgi:hypothetical protein
MKRSRLGRRSQVAALFLVGGLTGFAAKHWLTNAPPLADGGSRSALAEPAAELSLDKRIPEVWLVDIPFDEATQRVGQLAGIPVIVDRKDFASRSELLSEKVTIQLRNAPLADVLDQLIAPVRARMAGAAWYASGQVIRISAGTASAPMIVRTYEVSDLLQSPLPEPPFVPIDMSRRRYVINQRLAVATRPAPTTLPTSPAPGSSQYALLRLVAYTVTPASSSSSINPVGTMRFVANRLMIMDTPQNQRAVRLLLEELRLMAATKPATPPKTDSQYWEERLQRWVSRDSRGAEQRLRQNIDDFQATRLPALSVINRLGSEAGMDVLIDPPIESLLAELRPITIHLRNTPASEVLQAVLDTAAPALAGGSLLDWALEGDLLIVFRRGQYVASNSVTRQYDLRDWFRAAPIQAVLISGTPVDLPPDEAHDRLAQRLATLVVESVEPRSWVVEGRIRERGGFLIVTQTYANHERIRQLVERLGREAKTEAGNAGK